MQKGWMEMKQKILEIKPSNPLRGTSVWHRVWETVDAHSGYALPWSPFVLLPFFGGPEK